MATYTLNKASTTTWEINETGSTWILGSKGSITGTDFNGIATLGILETATVQINGEIDLGGVTSGIYMDSTTATITVADTGHISAQNAITYKNTSGTLSIVNDGLLEGQYGVVAYADHAEITNSGRIYGTFGFAKGIAMSGAAASIINSGSIKGVTGIYAIANAGDPDDPLLAENATHIVNTGKITGTESAIEASSVAVNIRNRGVLNGDILLSNGEDTVNTRGGTINGSIDLGAGNDMFDGRKATISGVISGGLGDDVVTLASPAQVFFEEAAQGSDTVRINATYLLGENIENLVLLGKGNHTGIGNVHANSLTGNKGANILYGFEGGDRLDGGKGKDLLFGGNDLDVFVFKPGNGKDTIGDFQDGVDRIDITTWTIGDFSELDGKKSQVGDNVVIAFTDTDTLVIRDMLAADITADDFNF